MAAAVAASVGVGALLVRVYPLCVHPLVSVYPCVCFGDVDDMG